METENPIGTEHPFELEDIEDARIIIVVKDKHYSIISNGDRERARAMRVALVWTLLSVEGHRIVIPALEDIDGSKLKEKLQGL